MDKIKYMKHIITFLADYKKTHTVFKIYYDMVFSDRIDLLSEFELDDLIKTQENLIIKHNIYTASDLIKLKSIYMYEE
jgi:hypothetical protein